jgi:hypothetical protein
MITHVTSIVIINIITRGVTVVPSLHTDGAHAATEVITRKNITIAVGVIVSSEIVGTSHSIGL